MRAALIRNVTLQFPLSEIRQLISSVCVKHMSTVVHTCSSPRKIEGRAITDRYIIYHRVYQHRRGLNVPVNNEVMMKTLRFVNHSGSMVPAIQFRQL